MHTYIATVNGQTYRIELLDEHHVRINGKVYEIDFRTIDGRPIYTLLASGRSYEATIAEVQDAWEVLLEGVLYRVQVEDERERRIREQAGQKAGTRAAARITSPMPGLVVEVKVEPGQKVTQDAVLLILESMKMQNEIRAPRDGVVKRVHVKPGQSVEQNALLVELE